MDANLIIDRFGGTCALARLCKVKGPSVTKWRHKGIPGYRLDFLRLARPEVFQQIELEARGKPAGAPVSGAESAPNSLG